MRLDHIAYRVADRKKTVEWFEKVFSYSVQDEFCIDFDNGEQAKCFALKPPEKMSSNQPFSAWVGLGTINDFEPRNYHLAPEIFVSDGTPNSIVGSWVAERGGVGGIHHLAYEVHSVRYTMTHLLIEELATFTRPDPIVSASGDLVQIFTDVHPLTGVIYEFIERKGAKGFNPDNVKDLMLSTDERDVA